VSIRIEHRSEQVMIVTGAAALIDVNARHDPRMSVDEQQEQVLCVTIFLQSYEEGQLHDSRRACHHDCPSARSATTTII